jgi:small ligand-binding sensory domain FIST
VTTPPIAKRTQDEPRFAGALSTEDDPARAIRSAIADLEAGLAGTRPDLVLAFATHHHGSALEGLGPALARATGAHVIAGCTAESVIGGKREVEGRPGVALWAAHLPGTSVRAVEVSAEAGPDDEPRFSRLPSVGAREETSLIVLADPYTFPADAFLTHLNDTLPGVPAMGGMASGAMGPGQTLFFSAEGVHDAGCVAIALEGATELVPVVSQGCRPVGKPWVITDCERNQIKKLGGRPALEVLMETLNELWKGSGAAGGTGVGTRRQSMPFLGLAIDPTRTRFQRGDFLVRGIMALNQRDRSVAVADFVRRGQTVQLLVRDAQSAGEDLRSLLAGSCAPRSPRGSGASAAAGALLFSCNGRGTRMFGKADHDAGCLSDALGDDVPVAGFFAAGEIGPVGGRNFLHGFTASVAVFRGRNPAE